MNLHHTLTRIGYALLLAALLAACGSAPETAPTPGLLLPTPLVTRAETAVPSPTPSPLPPTPTPTRAPTDTPMPSPTPLPTAPPPPAFTPTSTLEPLTRGRYEVAFVTVGDVLNVRTGPGVANPISGALPPNTDNVQITGPGMVVAGSTWVPIRAQEVTGWVNSRFLTQAVPEPAFCRDPEALALLAGFETAVRARDGDLLAPLVHPERGLRVRRHWWNPEILLSGTAVRNAFSSSAAYAWGIADGSGEPINGSFAAVILPLLERDLLEADRIACNEIIHGATAGLVQLPDGYQAVNFYALHRSPGDEIGFDWGTWVMGVEQWQGRYVISFLVHFDYEI